MTRGISTRGMRRGKTHGPHGLQRVRLCDRRVGVQAPFDALGFRGLQWADPARTFLAQKDVTMRVAVVPASSHARCCQVQRIYERACSCARVRMRHAPDVVCEERRCDVERRHPL